MTGKPYLRSMLAGLVVLLGATVMLGWFVRVPMLVQVLPGLQAMTFATALCFFLIGCALLAPERVPKWAPRVQSVIGYVVLALAGAMLVEQWMDIDLGIDLPDVHNWLATANLHPGRMAPNTALAFFLIGITLFLMHRVRGAAGAAVVGLATFGVCAIGAAGLIGYTLGVEFVYHWYGYSSMALHTAAGVVVSGVALLLSWRSLPWHRVHVDAKPAEHIATQGAVWLTAIALASGITGFMALWDRAEDNLGDTLTVAVHQRAKLFQSLIERGVANIAFVVSRPQLLRQLRVLRDFPDDREARAVLAGVADSFVASGFSAVEFYDRDGRRLVSSGDFVDKADLRVSLKAIHETELIWKDTFILRVHAPVVDDTEAVGTVVTEQQLPILTRALVDIAELGQTGDSGLCARRAEWLDCFPQRLRNEVASAPNYRNGKPRPIMRAISGETTTLRTVDYRGKDVVAAYAPVGTLGLGMSLKVDVEELYAPVRERLRIFVPLLLALIVIGALVLRFQIKPFVSELVRSREALRGEIVARGKIEDDLRRSNAELEHAMLTKDRFLASMSHELRTPLNGIIGFSEFLVDEKAGRMNEKQKEYLTDILNSGRHLLQLINDVLDLSKVQSGRMELFPETFEPAKAIEEVCAVISPLTKKKRITITRQIAAGMTAVTLDQHKFKQVLYNLLSNAVKFTGEAGRVEIVVGPYDLNRLRIQVRDSGIGIRPEDIGKLFGEFQQLDTGRARRYEGTGLGLALTKKIVELQRGMITVDSEPGTGSTFTVILPMKTRTTPAA